MNKPVLVVMAAGMGSRYGGMKQIDPVGPCGQVIVDYSLYDARRHQARDRGGFQSCHRRPRVQGDGREVRLPAAG